MVGCSLCRLDLDSNKPTLIVHPAIYNCPQYCTRKVVGKILLPFVYFLMIFQFFTSICIIVPYESYFLPKWAGIGLTLLACYFLINTSYHYIKARTTNAGRPIKSQEQPVCYHCGYYKAPNVSHCSICNQCVVDMDHHCIWINNCVGAGNIRHFIQFISFILLGAVTYVCASYRTYYNNRWNPTKKLMYCNMNLGNWPFYDYICSISPTFVTTCISYSFVIAIVMIVLLSTLFMSTFMMVSNKITYLHILKYGPPYDFWTMNTPWRRSDFYDTWRDVLGLRRGRTFIRHILFPSGHRTSVPLDWDSNEKTGYDSVPLITV